MECASLMKISRFTAGGRKSYQRGSMTEKTIHVSQMVYELEVLQADLMRIRETVDELQEEMAGLQYQIARKIYNLNNPDV